jgi:hypothetical protein
VLELDVVAYRVIHVNISITIELLQIHWKLIPLWMAPYVVA